MNEYNEEKISKNIKDSLNDLDKGIISNTPDIERLREMISQVETQKAKKAKKDAILFAIIAAIALSVETYAFNQSVLFFIVLQGIAFTSFIIGLLNWLIKTNKKVKSI